MVSDISLLASQVSLLKHPNGLQLCPEPTASALRVHPRYQIQVSLNISDIIHCLEGNFVAFVFICTFLIVDKEKEYTTS